MSALTLKLKSFKFKITERQLLFLTLSLLLMSFSVEIFAKSHNLGVGDTLLKVLEFVQYLFRFIAAFAGIATLILAIQGRPTWMMAITIFVACAIVANIQKILEWTGIWGAGITF